MTRRKGLIVAGLTGVLLVACSQSEPAMTVEVSGEPAAVARFVEAEKTRDADVRLTHAAGASEAVFVGDADVGFAISSRAIEARLSTRVRTGP